MSRGVKTAIIIGGVVVGLIIVLSIVSGSLWDHGFGMMGGFGWWWWPLPMLLFLAIVGLIIWAVVSSVGRSSPPPETKSGDSALEILRQRYARGEISREEYEAKRKDLMQ